VSACCTVSDILSVISQKLKRWSRDVNTSPNPRSPINTLNLPANRSHKHVYVWQLKFRHYRRDTVVLVLGEACSCLSFAAFRRSRQELEYRSDLWSRSGDDGQFDEREVEVQ